MTRQLSDGELEILREQNNDAWEAEAFWWREQHSGCDVEPCPDCLAIEQMDADAFFGSVEAWADCPQCGVKVEPGAFICPTCRMVLDAEGQEKYLAGCRAYFASSEETPF